MKNNTTDPGHLLRSTQKLLAHFEKKMESTTPLDKNKAGSIREAIADLLNSAEALDDRRQSLEALEQKMSIIQEDIPTNVIPIRRRHQRPPSAFSSVNDRRWILRLDCLIESRYISEIHKMALELHSQSRRYAFLEYRDVDKDCRNSPTELLTLGAITLFVPSILDLTFREQDVLHRIMSVDSTQRPLLMVGSTQTYSDLRNEAGVHREFLSQLTQAYIKLSRPFAEYKEQGLIHYFLDSLSESPS